MLPGMLTPTRLHSVVATAASLALLAGCSAPAATTAPGTTAAASKSASATSATSTTLKVSATMYPLAYLAQRVGGDHVEVTNLTKPGAEPHDLELTPQQVSAVQSSDLAITSTGIAPSVDKALASSPAKHVYDANTDAQLDLPVPEPVVGSESAEEHHEHGTHDPHFWLDPVRYTAVGEALAKQLATIDPDHAADYTKNATALKADLTTLDGEFSRGLGSCQSKDLVTAHAAFGYLSKRYGFHQVPIAGVSPDEEPSAKDLADITAYVKKNHVKTIYTESLVSPAIARTIASETGAQTAVLDPIEGLADSTASSDYLGVMRTNLKALQQGQGC